MSNRALTPFAIFIVTLGALFYCYEFFIQVSPAVMHEQLMSEFKINATLLGVLSSTFYYSYTALQIPAGLLLDRFGARIILTLTTAICAFNVGLFGMTHSLGVASLARFLMGASSAFAFIGPLYLIIRWIPPRHIALFIGLVQTLGSVGAIFGNGPLVSMMNYFGWRTSMVIFSIIGLSLAFLTVFIIRNKPHDFTDDLEKKTNLLKTLRLVFSNSQIWFCGIYSFMIWAPVTTFAALWGVSFLQVSAHLSPMTAANGIALLWIGVAIGSPLIGWISDAIGRRCLPLAIAAFLGLMAIGLIIYVQHISVFLIYVLLFIVGLAASGQSLIFAVIKDNYHTNHCSAANGYNNMMVVMSGALLQPLVGKLLDYSHGHHLIPGIYTYSLTDYHIALFVLPCCFALALIMSALFICETFCHQLY